MNFSLCQKAKVKGRSWGSSVGFEILVKKSRVEDTQAYREMTR